MKLHSKNLTLINCNERILRTILEGDEALAQKLNLIIPENWSIFGTEAFAYSLNIIQSTNANPSWLSYLPIENKSRILLGSCGYKGDPDENGIVEIGYEVAENYRKRGHATEIASLLVANAFSDLRIKKIIAHTLADSTASSRVLEKCNFQFVEEIQDHEDGKIWRWELSKNQFALKIH